MAKVLEAGITRKPSFTSWLCCQVAEGGEPRGWCAYSSDSKCSGSLPGVQLGLAQDSGEGTVGDVMDSATKLSEDDSRLFYLTCWV